MMAVPITLTTPAQTSLAQPEATAGHARLVKAAQQFEAILLQEILKPLGSSFAVGADDDGSSANAMQNYGVEAMAGALARGNALGFSKRMVASLEARTHHATEKDGTAQVSLQAADKPTGGN